MSRKKTLRSANTAKRLSVNPMMASATRWGNCCSVRNSPNSADVATSNITTAVWTPPSMAAFRSRLQSSPR